MSRFLITVEGKGLRKATIDKLVQAIEVKKDDAHVSVREDNPPSSRADRLEAAMSLVEDAKSEVESLRDEIQEWYDNLPEQFQSGDKGSQLEDCISELESLLDELEGIDGSAIEFPGMYS